MRTWLIAGLAVAAGVATAAAEQSQNRTEERRIVIRHGGDGPEDFARASRIDANHDGWVTRDEASAEADRIFADLDANHDGKLDDADHQAHHAAMEHEDMPPLPGEAAAPNDGRDIMIYRREVRTDGGHPGGGHPGADPGPPHPGHPPRPPMFMMMLMNHDEFDANHDGALQRDEFRTMQMRFFNAADGNGDGRIKFEPPPEPPTPPEPPEPPAPPTPAH